MANRLLARLLFATLALVATRGFAAEGLVTVTSAASP
jgi:hypothetical protein